MKRVLALILALSLCLSMVPGAALAQEADLEEPVQAEEVFPEPMGEASEEILPTEDPVQAPAEDPEEVPADAAEKLPEEVPEELPEEQPGEDPGEEPEQVPGEAAGQSFVLTVTEEPEDTLLLEGMAFFYVSAGVYLDGELTREVPDYQWQKLDGEDWLDLPDQTGQTLILEDQREADIGIRYRCRVSFGELEAVSQSAAIVGMAPQEEGEDWETLAYVNPLYADVLTEADLPEGSFADTYEEYTRYDSQEAFSQGMKQAIKNRQAEFKAELSVEGGVPVAEKLIPMLYAGAVAHTGVPTEGDYMRFEFGGYRANYRWIDESKTFQCIFYFRYYTTEDQEKAVDAEVARLLEQLDLAGKSQKEKIDAIYDYLCASVTYDNAHLNDKTYTLKYTAYAALIDHTAVCQGYATAFYRLCLECGVDTREVSSKAMNHAWNIVRLGKFYYCLDATWDAKYRNAYRYYLKGSKYWLEQHRANGTSVLGDEFADTGFAESYPVPEENYGENRGGFTLRADGTLVPEADGGRIKDYSASFLGGSYVTNAPWREVAEEVRRIEFPQGITYIGSNAFRGLTNLEELVLPQTVQTVEANAFAGCAAVARLEIPYGVKTVGSGAFQGLTNLEELVLPESVRSVESGAFRGCKKLKTLTLLSGPTVGSGAFSDCAVETLSVPAGWNARALSGCLDNLKTLIFTDDGYMASYSGSAAPWSGTGVETVRFDPGLKKIGEYALKNCREIKTLQLPRSLQILGSGALEGCSGLEELTLPAGLTQIGSGVFYGCSGLKELTFTGTGLPGVDPYAFRGVNITCRYDCTWQTAPRGGYGGTAVWKANHSPRYVEAVPVTETADGTMAHWLCTLCGKCFREEDCLTQLTPEQTVVYRETYAITYVDTEAGENPNPDRYSTAKGLVLQNGTRTGFLFGGWYTDAACTKRIAVIQAGTHGDLTLYPKWTAIRYYLMFTGNGGYGYAAYRNLGYNEQTRLPEDGFQRMGYRFTGWNTAANGSGTNYRPGDTVQGLTDRNGSTVLLYAQWTPISYQILLDPNDGESEPVVLDARYNESCTLPAQAGSRPGYHIAAWNTRPDGRGIGYMAGGPAWNLAYQEGAQVTLYGSWTPNMYTVAFHSNDEYALVRRQSFVYDREGYLAGGGFWRQGYTFAGWSETPDGEKKYANWDQVKNLTPQPDGVVDLYAVWTPNTYEILFQANGASGTMQTLSCSYGEAVTLPEMSFTRPGFTFLGWSVYAFGQPQYKDRAEVKNLSPYQGGKVVLYALWQAHSYEIRFHGNGSTFGSMPAMKGLLCGRNYMLYNNGFQKTNYDFVCWEDANGQRYNNLSWRSDYVLEDGGVLDLYAQWKPHPYTITYQNCITFDENPNPGQYDGENPVVFREPVRAGTEFQGWYLDFWCTKPVRSTEGLSGNLILYAKWGTAPTYSVHFEGGAGSVGWMPDMTNLRSGYVYGLWGCGFWRSGYTFQGWTRTPGGKTVEFTNGQLFGNLWQETGEPVTLYAVWKPNTYRISYVWMIAADENPNPETFTTEDTVVLQEPQRPGCRFQGWYLDGYYRTKVETVTPGSVTSNLVLYPKWENWGRGYSYTIAYNGNGAYSGTTYPQSCVNGVMYYLNMPGYWNPGHTFLGWSLDPEAKTPTWTNRALVGNLAKEEGQTITLYAVWK